MLNPVCAYVKLGIEIEVKILEFAISPITIVAMINHC